MKKILLTVLLASICSAYINAQPQLVKDICSGSCDSDPNSLYSYNNKLYFTASAPSPDMWVFDGLQAIHLNAQHLAGGFLGYNNKVYFYGSYQLAPKGLWASDGTTTGTGALKALDNVTELTLFKNLLFFAGTSGAENELWVSDGTEAGTKLFKNIDPLGSAAPRHLTVVDNMLFFTASINGDAELWVTDGTEAGTRLVKDIHTTASSSPNNMIAFNGRLYFTAYDVASGRELWMSDGTDAGTQLVKDIEQAGTSDPALLTVCNGKLFFSAKTTAEGRELWVSDGTGSGTQMVKDIDPAATATGSSWMAAMGNKVFFRQLDGSGDEHLWSSDGTDAGTQLVSSAFTKPAGLTVIGDQLFFYAESPDATSPTGITQQLWRTGGSSANTSIITTASAPYNAVTSTEIANLGNEVFYRANYDAAGSELWKTSLFANNIDETTKNTAIILYPNPVTDVLNIKLSNNTEAVIRIISSIGQVYMQAHLNRNQGKIDLSMLPAGIYFAHIIKENTTSVEKIIKQ